MRLGLVALLGLPAATAFAEPAPFEASGFIGVNYFGDDIGLGDSVAAEQRPQTSPTFGGRVSYLALHAGPLSFGGELEATYSPAETGTSTATGVNGPRASADTPVVGYRALLLLRLGHSWIQPHLEGGVGGATITTSSEFVSRDTDASLQWGVGLTFPMSDQWQLRVDARQGFTESRDVGSTSTYEIQLGIGKSFGGPSTRTTRATTEVFAAKNLPPVHVAAAAGITDLDGDGIPDTMDKCPKEPELVNGIDDQDGCPEVDPDHDRIIGALDRCPNSPEDYDHFEDADGCPDLDNDTDGIPDAKDKCPNEPETKNGFDDQDGCPDAMPTAMLDALDAASKVTFEPSRPRMSPNAKSVLDKTVSVLLANPKLRVTIILHPDGTTDGAKELATKRADVLKWHLVEQGVAANQLLTTVGSVGRPNAPAVELLVTP